tara:strand:- start:2430 stop:2576 length:147 start_codon:yes stop_codon:yes gene_type:complete
MTLNPKQKNKKKEIFSREERRKKKEERRKKKEERRIKKEKNKVLSTEE